MKPYTSSWRGAYPSTGVAEVTVTLMPAFVWRGYKNEKP
jgi:hypothetical protein